MSSARAFAACSFLLVVVACGGGTAEPAEAGTGNPAAGGGADVPALGSPSGTAGAGCGDDGGGLAGAAWSLGQSRFAFGGAPTEESAAGGRRFVGPEGVVAVSPLGMAMGVPNSGASAGMRGGYGRSAAELEAHSKAYLQGFGILACQIMKTQTLGSMGGGGPVGGPTTTTPGRSTIVLERAVDGIALPDSHASAQLNDLDQAVQENLFWPPIDGAVVAAAKRWRDELKDATKLAAFKAKLPEGARGEGSVVIHHSIGSGPPTDAAQLRTGASWDTLRGRSPVSFDETGALLPPNHWR